jgi:hypothetical protein
MDEDVATYLKGDRQWLRAHRIAHVELQLATATEDKKAFWKAVLKRLK